jgi:hypothetical protein
MYDMRQFANPTSSEFLLHHRINLWQDFHILATAPAEDLGIGGKPATAIWDGDAVDVDCESVEVYQRVEGLTIQCDRHIAQSKSTILTVRFVK